MHVLSRLGCFYSFNSTDETGIGILDKIRTTSAVPSRRVSTFRTPPAFTDIIL